MSPPVLLIFILWSVYALWKSSYEKPDITLVSCECGTNICLGLKHLVEIIGNALSTPFWKQNGQKENFKGMKHLCNLFYAIKQPYKNSENQVLCSPLPFEGKEWSYKFLMACEGLISFISGEISGKVILSASKNKK